MSICGIYAIENLVNGKVYIGQSVDIESRFRIHKWHLNNNCHINYHLQRSYNKYGSENFSFKIIDRCEEDDLNNKEIFYIKKYRKENKTYNLTNGGDGTRGHKHTEESKRKMSEYQKGKHKGEKNNFYGKKHTKETREKISELAKGRPGNMKGKTHTEHAKKKMSEFHKGRQTWNKGISCSEETKLKISEANKGRTVTEEARRKMSENRKGRSMSAEHKAKISEALKGNTNGNANKGKPSPLRGRIMPEEHKKKIGEANRGKRRKQIGCDKTESTDLCGEF